MTTFTNVSTSLPKPYSRVIAIWEYPISGGKPIRIWAESTFDGKDWHSRSLDLHIVDVDAIKVTKWAGVTME